MQRGANLKPYVDWNAWYAFVREQRKHVISIYRVLWGYQPSASASTACNLQYEMNSRQKQIIIELQRIIYTILRWVWNHINIYNMVRQSCQLRDLLLWQFCHRHLSSHSVQMRPFKWNPSNETPFRYLTYEYSPAETKGWMNILLFVHSIASNKYEVPVSRTRTKM